jgi:sugar/nucleoside kinase (ribokinase family)
MSRIDLQLKKAARGASVMGSGFIALDFVYGQNGLFHSTGGSCGNVLIALSWLGWKSTPVARLGAGPIGDFVVEEMEAEGVDLSLVQQTDGTPTPVVIQRFVDDPAGRRHRFSLVCPDCGAWLPRYRSTVLSHAEEAMEDDAPKVYYFDRASPATVALAEWAKEEGAVVLFEPSSIGEDQLFERAVDACHILKFSDERFGLDSELCQARGPQLIVRTMGSEGLQARWKGRWSSLASFEVPKLVDAAGAGDWCSVGLLHVLGQKGEKGLSAARKVDVERGLRLGQALAALNCGYEGARGLMTAVHSVEQVDRLLRSASGGAGELDFVDEGSAIRNEVKFCMLCSDVAKPKAKAVLRAKRMKR